MWSFTYLFNFHQHWTSGLGSSIFFFLKYSCEKFSINIDWGKNINTVSWCKILQYFVIFYFSSCNNNLYYIFDYLCSPIIFLSSEIHHTWIPKPLLENNKDTHGRENPRFWISTILGWRKGIQDHTLYILKPVLSYSLT